MAFLNETGLEKLLQNVGAKLQEKVDVAEGKELMPTSEEANMMLVTDGSGETKWEERTHWKEKGTIGILLSDVVVGESGALLTTKLELVPGESYTVTWNGVDYTCIAAEDPIDGIPAVCLGYTSPLGGNLSDEYPFIIVEFTVDMSGTLGEGAYGIIGGFDTTEGTLSLLGSTIIYHKLLKEYLPDEMRVDTLNIANGPSLGSVTTRYANMDKSLPVGLCSFAEGRGTHAIGEFSHAEGSGLNSTMFLSGEADSCIYTTLHGQSATVGELLQFESTVAQVLSVDGATITLDTSLSDIDLDEAEVVILKGVAFGNSSHAEGNNTIASGDDSHAEGNNTIASGSYSHSEGTGATANGYASHAEGYRTTANGKAHAEGSETTASGVASHAEGISTTASGGASHAEGINTTASGHDSHTEGDETTASGDKSHAEGYKTTASGENSHAEGFMAKASGKNSHAEGYYTKALKDNSHAEGSWTNADGEASHAEGSHTYATGHMSHAEGSDTNAGGEASHAEGLGAYAIGNYSHAEGSYTRAFGTASHAEGDHTSASYEYQHVQGKYNIVDKKGNCAHIVGNGESDDSPSNAHTLDWDGNAWFSGDVYVGSTSGVDRDEGSKKLATEDYVDEVKATSSTVINIIEKYNIDLNQVYDTNFDLATYVNQAIQEATEEGKLTSGDTLYLPPAKYRVLTPIIVNKSVNLKFEGSLEYQGTDFAIEFSNYSYCTADINRIRALNGSCIKILSDSTLGHGPIIYSTFKFNRLLSNSDTGYCFYAEIKGTGYIGQNKFVGGQCGGGFCAFKINNVDSYTDGFGGNLFESMAVEGGFKEGFHFTDWCVNNTLFNCNLEESGDGYIKGIITEGYNSGLKVIGSSNFYRSYMDLSDTTDGMVIGSMRDSNAKLIDSYAYIVRGDFVLEKHDRTKDLTDVVGIYDMANVVVDYNDTEYRPNYSEIGLLQYNNEYTEFLTGNQCNGIILSKKYGHINGINEFSVVFQRDNIGTFVIKNYLSEEISYEVPQIAGVTVRFKWVCEQNDEYGGEWKYSYEFADVSKMRDFLTSKDDIASYHSVLNTVTGGVTTDAVGGRAASVITSFAPSGVLTELNTLTLDVNGNKYTTDLPANVYQGTYDWVTGEINSTATKILAKDKCQITESGVNSSGINYILIDGEGINFLDLIASNRYIRKDDHPYVDKSIRAKNNGDAYLYDSAIDLNNPAAILEGLELLFPSESVTVAAHPKTITLNSGENTITTENGEVLEMTYGIDAKTYINNQIQTYVNEAILGGAW